MKLYVYETVRTNNFEDKDIMNKILGMWDSFYKNNDDYNGKVYAVYYDYESNYKGDYSLALCTEDILADKFFEVDFAKSIEYKCAGKDEIITVWKRIWEDEEENKIKRSYDIDCEEYKKDGSVVIHLF
ncbi:MULTISPECIES: effector binding domain-containing protein [unclassified Staphylococcus]|uniref:effector binding domain-containing protein n=1 Tax=unclassified Staphylococcus TaxID=91994 RepID=UPI002040E89E|nr:MULTISPECIES: effector binding domain-containing protein [unclassified Staphylococcus]